MSVSSLKAYFVNIINAIKKIRVKEICVKKFFVNERKWKKECIKKGKEKSIKIHFLNQNYVSFFSTLTLQIKYFECFRHE